MATKKKVNREDYIFKNQSNQTLVKLPGQLNGSAFNIENLNKCEIKIFDYSNQILVDDCKDCIFIIGPVQNSIFFRNCSTCKIAVICNQFRLSNCKGLQIKLFTTTDPAIEDSDDLEFGPYNILYPFLDQQIIKAETDLAFNFYRQVFDHSPPLDESKKHFRFCEISQIQVIQIPIEGVEAKDPPNDQVLAALYSFEIYAQNSSDYSMPLAKTQEEALRQEAELMKQNNLLNENAFDELSKEENKLNTNAYSNDLSKKDAKIQNIENLQGFAKEEKKVLGFHLYEEDEYGRKSDKKKNNEFLQDNNKVLTSEEETLLEKVKEDNQKRMEEMYQKQLKEQAQKEELNAKSKEWLDQARTSFTKEKEARRKNNEQSEETLKEGKKEQKNSNPWEKVITLIELKEGNYPGSKNVTRMKQSVLGRKNDIKQGLAQFKE